MQQGNLPYGYDHKYVYSHFGYNLKATDMQAAIGVAQIKKLPSFIEHRRKNFKRLMNALEPVADKLILPEAFPHSNPSWFGFPITCTSSMERNKIVDYLEINGIQTRTLFAGNFIQHPCFDDIRNNNEEYRIVGSLANTERIMNSTFWVGVYPGLTEQQIDYIASIIIKFVNSYVKEKQS